MASAKTLFTPTPYTTMINNLEELYYDQIRDLRNAETQLVNSLPEMASSASSPVLRDAFNMHLEETRHHVERLDAILQRHGLTRDGVTCEAMRGLIEEAKKHVSETQPGNVRDAVLIASANRVEHYEIAGYGVAKTFAKCLGFEEDFDYLEATLDEEAAADEKLTKIATGGVFGSGVNESAMNE
jgi:ferritin-like metal-binding protein YciE